jgi:hypothetical protein
MLQIRSDEPDLAITQMEALHEEEILATANGVIPGEGWLTTFAT